MTVAVAERDYSLTVYEGWHALVKASRRERPADLTCAQIAALSNRERLRYNESRRIWHANMGPFLTPEMHQVVDEVDTIVQSNRQDGDKVRSGAVLDAYPGLGKTTLAVLYGTQFHREQIELYGPTTADGHERIPVAYIRLTSNTTMRSLNSMLCRFYAHPSWDRGNATQLGARASECARATGTRLIVVDDVHFLDMQRRDGREVANHFKFLANEFPVTFFFVGVGIADKGLLSEGLSVARQHYAQTARRWTRLTLSPFRIDCQDERRTWRRLLLAIERDLVLANKTNGMIAKDLADYLYARSTGHFASLMSLIARGCHRAVKTGQEALTSDLLNQVRNDAAAEDARRAIEASMCVGLRTMRRGL